VRVYRSGVNEYGLKWLVSFNGNMEDEVPSIALGANNLVGGATGTLVLDI